MDYTWQWGQLRVVPQFKYLYLRLRDREADQDLRFEDRVIPILKVAHPLMSRTMLQAGVQGWGPVPYRLKNRTQKRESFERRSTFISLTNSSRYFGYNLYAIIGFNRDEADFDDPLQRLREFDGWSFFVRGLVGFTEFGRPL